MRLAAQIAGQRQSGQEESPSLFEYALSLLDRMVLDTLNAGVNANLEAINTQLAVMVERDPAIGESYKVLRLGGTPPAYALVANFGLSGPSAVRVYQLSGGPRYRMTAKVDRFTQKDFFDDYLEVVPVTADVPLFVTITGRTDELKSGAFTAWRVNGAQLESIWSTEILPHSSYEAVPGGFRLTYCADYPEDRPRDCRRMVRERYNWDGKAWQRAEQQNLPPTPPKN